MKMSVAVALFVAVAGAVCMNAVVDAQQTGVGQNQNIVTGSADQFVGDMFRQRQNEAVLGISSVNPLHQMAAYNDYRTVDFADDPTIPPSPINVLARIINFFKAPWTLASERKRERERPGDETEMGDSAQAWIGLSFTDNGKDWYTGLLPGHPFDFSGLAPALRNGNYQAASDPVMATSADKFFVGGIAFTPGAQSAGFVARFTDRNFTEVGRNIQFDWVKPIVTVPTGFFVDKPNLAAGPDGHVYVAYVVFDQNDPQKLSSKIYFYRSTDYGETWSTTPVILSDPLTRNQSPWILVDPNNENIVYVGWRVFANRSGGIANAIVGRKSTNGGGSFIPTTPYTVASQLKAFDQPQGTLPQSLPIPRSNAYPTATIDGNGALHAAIQEYVSPKDGTPLGPGTPITHGIPRITVTSSYDGGVNWTGRKAVDYGAGSGTQFMPVLTAAGEPGTSCTGSSGPRSRIMLMYYDARAGNVGTETGTNGWVAGGNKQFDVRLASAPACPRDSGNRLVFTPSVQMSRYSQSAAEPHGIVTDAGFEFTSVNRGYSMFCGGNCAFTGDYIHAIPRVPYVLTPAGWRPTTSSAVDKAKLPAPVVQGVWADARDVKLPTTPKSAVPVSDPTFIDSLPWWNYQAPGSGKLPAACENAGARDQNIYTAEYALTELFAAAPETFRTSNIPRAYPIYVENRAATQRLFRLRIDSNATASFDFKSFATSPPNFNVGGRNNRIADVVIAAYSSITGSVVVGAGVATPVSITVEQVDGNGTAIPGGAKTSVTLYTAGTAPASNTETHLPLVSQTPIITKPFAGRTPISFQQSPFTQTPFTQTPFTQTPFTQTPFTQTAFTQNPFSQTPFTQTPFTQTTTIFDVTDISFLVSNGGSSTAAFSTVLQVANAQLLEGLRSSNSYLFQVFINRLSPAALLNGCQSVDGYENVQVSSIVAPFTQTPFTQTPFTQTPFTQTPFTQTPFTQTSDPRDPVISNSTFYVAPPSPVEQTARSQAAGAPRVANARLTFAELDAAFRRVSLDAAAEATTDFRSSRPSDLIVYVLRLFQIKDAGDSTFVNFFAANGQPQVGITVQEDTPAVIQQNGQAVFDPAGQQTTSGGSAVPVKLGFVIQPTSTTPGAAIAPPIQVAIQDGFGNLVSASTLPVTIGIGFNAGPGTLSGTLTRNAIGGIATFDNLSINTPGVGYTLVATSGSLAPATSTAFNIATPFVVTNTNDSGTGSLRQMIINANAAPNGTTPIITFNIPGAGVHTISPTSALPTLTHPMMIEGGSQPGWASGAPVIEIEGSHTPADTDGLRVTGSFVTIRGLIVNRFSGEGIRFDKPATAGIVQDNFIGTNAAGTAALGNGKSGVYVRRTGGIALFGNTISGNIGLAGVAICSSPSFCGGGADTGNASDGRGNVVSGNRIGTNAAGTAAVPNAGYGISIDGAPETLVGVNVGNVIAGNGGDGILVWGGPGADGNLIKGNNIGVGADGSTPIPNGLPSAAYGVSIVSGAGNVIGGTEQGEGNVIAANLYGNVGLFGTGVTGTIIQGNYIGLNAVGDFGFEAQSFGINVSEASGTIIGAPTDTSGGNVISSNEKGIQLLGTSSTTIQGNKIGTSASGAVSIGNGVGIFAEGASSTAIGGAATDRNVVSGNITGIHILAAAGETAADNTISNNLIGTAADGVTALPNTRGILLQANPPSDLSAGVLRGSAITSNTVAYNDQVGITVAGAGATGNPILNNSIYGTGTLCTTNCGTPLGIDLSASSLGGDGVTLNDAGDADLGGNNLQNFPAITGATPTTVTGTLSTAPGVYTIQLFSNAACSASGFGEGRTLIASFGVTTDAGGLASFSQAGLTLTSGQQVTATATRLIEFATETSEFAQCVTVAAGSTPSQLSFITQPPQTPMGTAMTPAVQVAIVDSVGNLVANATNPVTIAIGNNPSGGVLSGTLTRNAVGGVATFDNLSINAAGAGYTLVASSGTLTASSSNPFTITNPFMVTHTGDSGPGSLRAAMTAANAAPVGVVPAITFAIVSAPPHNIVVQAGLPIISRPVSIDATTQPDYAGAPTVLVDGSQMTGTFDGPVDGFTFLGGSSAIRGLAIGGFTGNGIVLRTGGNNLLSSNYVGTNLAGTLPFANGGHAVLVDNSPNNVIGGTTGTTAGGPCTGSCNVLSGNTLDGVHILNSAGTIVQRNHIGVNAAGAAALGNHGNGVVIDHSTGTVIGSTGTSGPAGNVISDNANGAQIIAGNTNQLQGNIIGLNAAGNAAIGNAGSGVLVEALSAGLTIGGSIIAANGADGIRVTATATGTFIGGNIIGANIAQTARFGNAGNGVLLEGPATVGGNPAFARNVIVANSLNGIQILADGVVVRGNKIGTTDSGAPGFGNTLAGVSIEGGSNNIVGDAAAVQNNTIANNASAGVRVTGGTGNSFVANAIFGNGGLGIDLGADGVTANDTGDGDGGPNGLQNYPVITDATTATITGTLNSTPGSTFTVHLYRNAVCDPSGFGEGQQLISSVPATTDGAGNAAFSLNGLSLTDGEQITATATGADGSTSEFSSCRPVLTIGGPAKLAVTSQPTTTFAGAVMSPVQVTIQDAAGNTVTSAASPVTIALGTNPSGGTLAGTLTRNAVNGVATFNDLSINNAGAGYTLVATSTGLTSATSQSFTIQASAFSVTSTGDSGTGTLRQAIQDANGMPPGITSTIRFNFTGPAPHVIAPQSPLPLINASMIIDGTTGGVCTGVPPSIQIDGAQAAGAHGLVVNSPGVIIRGLSITRFAQSGVFLAGGGNNVVECNWLGTEPGGTALGNQDGVRISGSSGNVVGGTTPPARNIISGNIQYGVQISNGTLNEVRGNYIGTNPTGGSAVPNSTGVFISADSNHVVNNLISGNTTGIEIGGGAASMSVTGNFIGTDQSGVMPVANQNGIRISNAPGNTIGGSAPGSRNVVSGNSNVGVEIVGANAHDNAIQGNYIGTTADGLFAVPNARGVEIVSTTNNHVGGTTAAARNVISGNASVGLEIQGGDATGNVVEGNFIGVNAAGNSLPNEGAGVQILDAVSNTIGGPTAASGNTIAFNGQSGVQLNSSGAGTPLNNAILSNSIHSNEVYGISLGGIPTNDPGDGDQGINNLQNYPVIATATSSSIAGSLNSTANTAFTIQLFSNVVCDPSQFGEGQTLIQTFTLTTDEAGNAPFTRPGLSLTSGHMITATATDPNGSTSAFSACTQVDPNVTITPNPVNLVTNSSASMTATLSHIAGPSGVTITLSSSDPVVTVPASVTIAANQTTANFDVTSSVTTGSSTITGSAAGFADGTSQAAVSLRTMTLSAPSTLIGVGRSLTGTITLGQPAPTGGLSVHLVSSATSFVTVSPADVAISAGATIGTFTINGVAAGSSTITATAPGTSSATLNMTATTSSLISMGNPPTIAPGQTSGVAVSLGVDAPAGGVTVSFVSSDTNVATVTPSVFIPAGLRIPAANPQITGVLPGTASITASAPGFAPDTRTATITLTLTFTPATGFAVIAGRTSNITLNLSAPAPAAGLTLNTSIDNTAFATVPATVFVASGLTSVQVPVTGVAVGTTTIRASGTGIAEATASVRVDPTPVINISNLTLGKDLQSTLSGSLGLAAPPGGVVVTITSTDPSRVLLATADNVAGSASITRTVNAGSSFLATFWVQALVGTGTADIQASAPGYATDTSTITFNPSGFIINAGNFTTNTRATNVPVRVDASRLNPTTGTWAQTMEVRGGLAVDVPVVSSNTGVGTIVGSPAHFTGGTSFVNVSFDPVAQGTSTISLPPPPPTGFSTPVDFQSITATVTLPTLTINNVTLGKDLQTFTSGFLGAPAPAGGLDVTITSADAARLLLSTSQTAAGSASIVLHVNAGSSSIPTYYVQALNGSGTVQYTATASGYQTGSASATLHPSGFILNTNDFTTNTFAPNVTIRIDASRLSPTNLHWAQTMELRAGLTVPVTVTSSNTGVGTIVGSPVSFSGGDLFKNVAFDPQSSGTSTVSITTPTGFSTPGDFQSAVATVTAPNITVGNATVGRDLQMTVQITLASAPPSPVDVTVTSNDDTIATVTRDGAIAGTGSVTFLGVTGTNVGFVYVQGRGVGTTSLTVSAANFNNGTGSVTVHPSGFILNLNDFTTNTFAGNTTLRVDAARLSPTTLNWAQSMELRGGLGPINIAITSSDTNVGQVIGSPVVFNAGDLFKQTASFDPATAGTTTISITQPAGFTTPHDFQAATATVNAPPITLGNANVGRDLQTTVQIALGAVPPSPVTVTVTSNNTGIATVTRNGAVEGSAVATFTNVTTQNVGTIYVQGRALGTTTVTVQAAGYADGTSSVKVDPSGFILNMNDFTTNTFAANTALRLDAARLDPVTLNWSQSQEVRGGLANIQIPITSSNTTVGTIVGSPAVFNAGDLFNQTARFDPANLGTTTISIAQPTGFSVPSNFQSVIATVNAPTISVGNATVGVDLQMSLNVTLQDAPPGPVTVTVTSSDQNIATVTNNGTIAGGSTITFTNVTTTNVGTIFVQGRALGSTTITTQAVGYATDTSSVVVHPSGFILNMSDFTLAASAANRALRVDAARLDPTTLNWSQSQELRGGLTNIQVPITSSNTSVGTIVGSPAVFNPRDIFIQTVAFDPQAQGTSTITIGVPAGFSTPSNFRMITATVTP